MTEEKREQSPLPDQASSASEHPPAKRSDARPDQASSSTEHAPNTDRDAA
jgi:hypothetical protein